MLVDLARARCGGRQGARGGAGGVGRGRAGAGGGGRARAGGGAKSKRGASGGRPRLVRINPAHFPREPKVDPVAHADGLRRVEEVAADDVDADRRARDARARLAARERALHARAHEARHLLHHAHHRRVRDAHTVVVDGLDAAIAQRALDDAARADDEQGAHAEQREDGDLLHQRVEQVRVLEHFGRHVEDHRRPLVHLDVRRRATEEVDEGGAGGNGRHHHRRAGVVDPRHAIHLLQVEVLDRLAHRVQRPERRPFINRPIVRRLAIGARRVELQPQRGAGGVGRWGRKPTAHRPADRLRCGREQHERGTCSHHRASHYTGTGPTRPNITRGGDSLDGAEKGPQFLVEMRD